MSAETLLEVRNLRTYFYVEGKVVKAVDDVSFDIKKGETVAIVGESGSGKSITSLSIMRLIASPPGKIEEGSSIKLDGKELLNFSERQMTRIRGNDIGMIFQEPMTSLNPVFTIGNQIAETVMRHQGLSKAEAYERAVQLLKLVGFKRAEENVHDYPHQLSGGMRQRAMIAMAMSCDPKLLIADEPTTALDVTIQKQILELMLDVKNKFDSSILLITHDLGVVAEVADRVIVMYHGKIVEEADVETIFENPVHPYTKGLLGSIPKIGSTEARLKTVADFLKASDSYNGQQFAPDFFAPDGQKYVKESKLIEIEPGHKVRVFV